MSFVIFVNGLTLLFFAALMVVDAAFFHATAGVFMLAAMLVGLAGTALCLVSSSDLKGMQRLHTFLMTSSVWMSAALAGAVPLALWQLSPTDAFFEAMSGITTTGSTVMSGLDQTPRGIIMWRAMLQAVGGVGFIVTAIALLPILKVGGMQLFRTESSDKGDKELRSAALFATATLQIYAGLIVLCAIVYLAGGMNLFDAITHAMTTLSTGGYSGYDASFGHFQSPFLQWSATLFMLLGGLPFAWYIRGVYRGSFASEQVRMMLWSLAGVISVLTLWMVFTRDVGLFDALRMVSFNVISVVTTTGYATEDYTLWGTLAVVAFFFLMAVGGCTGSTAGGAKAMRWLIFFRLARAQISRVYSPNRVVSVKYEGRRVDEDVASGVVSFFIFYAATFAALSIALTLMGVDMTTATSAALTSLANVGPGIGDIIGPAGNFATLSDPAKLLLILGMFLGRLEMLTVFVLFTPRFWREISDLGPARG